MDDLRSFLGPGGRREGPLLREAEAGFVVVAAGMVVMPVANNGNGNLTYSGRREN
jgi:hypothetical protein